MYSWHIVEMVDDLIAAGVIQESLAGAAVTALKECWRDKIADVWGVEDVRFAISEYPYSAIDPNKIPLSDADAITILDYALNEMDADYGINWTALRNAAEECGHNLQKLRQAATDPKALRSLKASRQVLATSSNESVLRWVEPEMQMEFKYKVFRHISHTSKNRSVLNTFYV